MPFCVDIEPKKLQSLSGPIYDYDTFVAFVRSNFEEGVKLFLHPEFKNIVIGSRYAHRALYQGLMGGKSPDLALEEFLVGAGLKQPLQISVDETPRHYENLMSDFRDRISIRRSTWGYVMAEVTVEGSFLLECKGRITASDFDGTQKLS